MKRLALAIQTFPRANDALRRHWPNFLKAGADEMLVISTTCGKCWTPDGVLSEMIGADLYITGGHLPSRLLRTFQRLRDTKADWFCVAEYDVLFLKSIPRDLPEGLTAHLAGGKPAGCHCNAFYHGPWCCDRETADTIVQCGYEILASKQFDASPDCFLGQIVEKAQIPVHTDILKSYSRNTIHAPWDDEALEAVRNGAVCVHGVKTEDVFSKLTQA